MKIKDPKQVTFLDDKLTKPFKPDNQKAWLLIEPIYHKMIYDIAGERWIFKDKGTEYCLNELLGETISKYFELPTVHPQIAFLIDYSDDSLGVLIKIFFQSDHTYFYIDNFPHVSIQFYHHNLENLNFLSTYYNDTLDDDIPLTLENIEKLKNSLKKMIVRDYFANQQDRSIENFMFQEKDGYVSLAPLYDHEFSFGDYPYGNSFFNLALFDPRVRKIIKDDDDFKKLIIRGMALNIPRFISQVEDEHHIILDSNEKERITKTLKRQKHKVTTCQKDLGI